MENFNIDLKYKGDKPIKGVFGGKPFHSFNVDADLDRIDEEVCRALATSNLDFVPNVYGEKPPTFEEEAGRPPLEDPTEPKVSGLNNQETRKYRIFKREIDIPWTFAVALKPNRYETRDQDIKPWSSVAKKTPYTKHVIENKMGFETVGRVMIYGSWAGSSVPVHVDEVYQKQVLHINFNPGHSRPVYVWDPITRKKIYKPEEYKFYTFNTMDYHGVDPLPYFTYTIRVDGVL
jgi:hypothetical protein